MSRDKDIRIEQVRYSLEDSSFRTPIKFGGQVVFSMSQLHVEIEVVDRKGRSAKGRGSMPLGNVWSFPSKALSFSATLEIMKDLAGRLAVLTAGGRDFGHPLEINHALEPEYLRAAAELQQEKGIPEKIPKLCTLVVASPFDAAVHDAYGRIHGINIYNAYGPGFVNEDLSFYLGSDFSKQFLDRYILEKPKVRMPIYHLIGALDPLTDDEVKNPVRDGVPETLGEWIRREGLTHFKLKLDGGDSSWDLNRILAVDRVCREGIGDRRDWFYSFDFNERCPHVEYLVEILKKFSERSPAGYSRLQYVEQPTSRHLKEAPEQDMSRASSLKPVVIDEALTDLESLDLALRLGYSGAALKVCKGQSQSLILATAAQARNLFLCVQDLTCPGASFLHSAGLAARIPGVAAVEANARQYCPEANRGWDEMYPGLFRVREGTIETGSLNGPGVGFEYPAGWMDRKGHGKME
jgi:L-alanine-DL-glutamate epimerase-like enolase superfamily enzyme